MGLADMAVGVNSAIKGQLVRRLQAEKVAREVAQQQVENELRQKQFESTEELKQAQLANLAESRRMTAEQQGATIAHTLADTLPPGTELQQNDPAVGAMRRGGMGGLLTIRGIDAVAPPPWIAAPDDADYSPEVPGTYPNSPSPAGPRLFTKGASGTQQNALRDDQRAAAIAGQTAAGQTADRIERKRHDIAMENRPVGGAGAATLGDDAESIAESIATGLQPPTLTGLYRGGLPVRAALARKGYNLTNAMVDWQATTRHIATLNGPQQERMRQAVDNAYHSLDVIEELANKWDGGKFPVLNRARLKAAQEGALGLEAQQIATNLQAQINDVTSELGNVYIGGNSPTDHALALAGKNLNADWTRDQLISAINLSRGNLKIRQNSMMNSVPAGTGPVNNYAPPALGFDQGGGGGVTSGGTFTVNTPDGPQSFRTQAEADAFKREAGL